jgi:hypothetical protein
VADKSPRQSSSKKSGKSLKEKRHDKKEAANDHTTLSEAPARHSTK